MTDYHFKKFLELVQPDIDFDIEDIPSHLIILILIVGLQLPIVVSSNFMFLIHLSQLIKKIT